MQQETKESTWSYEVLGWLEVHKKEVLIGAAVGLAVVLGSYIYRWNRAQTELEASRQLLALRAISTSENLPLAPTSDFLKVARTYPSTDAGQRALLFAAGTLFSEGKYAEAQAQFEKFLNDYRDNPLAPIAALGVAAGLEAQGDYDKAITAFQGVAARYPNDSAAERAKLALGGLYAAKNQPQQALRLYEELAKPASMSGLATEAAMKRRDLLRKHPELAAAIKPAVPSPGAASTNLVVTNAPGAKAPATNQTSGKPSPAQAPSP